MSKTAKKADRHPRKKYPTLGACGLDCGMCPRYYTAGPSRCPGCAGPGFFDRHPSCSFITCCVKGKGLEVCGECPDFPCSRSESEVEYRGAPESSSYPSYRNVFPNFRYVKKNGIEKFIAAQKARIRLLERMIKEFDDGRSKSFFCKAAVFLEANGLKASLDEAERVMRSENIEKSDVKARAKILKRIIAEIAVKEGVDYFKNYWFHLLSAGR
ncbi:MAG: DUF3795 domain-containing protein [Spirochaetales bacterium]|nr:DUF3795 domain-containing protein [Spirochaetales bacterium]